MKNIFFFYLFKFSLLVVIYSRILFVLNMSNKVKNNYNNGFTIKKTTDMEYYNSFFSNDNKAKTIVDSYDKYNDYRFKNLDLENNTANISKDSDSNILSKNNIINNKNKEAIIENKNKLIDTVDDNKDDKDKKLSENTNTNTNKRSIKEINNHELKNKENNKYDKFNTDNKLDNNFTKNNNKLNSNKKLYPKHKHRKKIFKNNFNNQINEGWLSISSITFKDKNKFPDIILPNGTRQSIPIDNLYFRINNLDCNNRPNCRFHFWFRLSKENSQLFYASSNVDLNILGSISYNQVYLDSYIDSKSNNNYNQYTGNYQNDFNNINNNNQNYYNNNSNTNSNNYNNHNFNNPNNIYEKNINSNNQYTNYSNNNQFSLNNNFINNQYSSFLDNNKYNLNNEFHQLSSQFQSSKPYINECGVNYCMSIIDDLNSNWKICSLVKSDIISWYCSIKRNLHQIDNICNPNLNKMNFKKKPDIIEQITKPVIVIPLPSKQCNEGWNYQNNGDDWECECQEGIEQSPIDLPKRDLAIQSPVKPIFSYIEVDLISNYNTIDKTVLNGIPNKLKYQDNALKLLNLNMGKVVTIDGSVYIAEEIVFHTPSEHTIDGQRFDMEVQVIHYGYSKGDIAKQLTLSFLIKKKAGVYNRFFDSFDITDLPNSVKIESAIIDNIYIPRIFYSTYDDRLLGETTHSSGIQDIPYMKPFSFYTYQGSLTAPPCSQDTIVYVAADPIYLSSTTIQLFQEALRPPDIINETTGEITSIHWRNISNRNIQNKNNRPVFFYNHILYCGEEPKVSKPIPKGHYEKLNKKATEYFYVNGQDPSGLPGAYVVSEKEAKGIVSDEEINKIYDNVNNNNNNSNNVFNPNIYNNI